MKNKNKKIAIPAKQKTPSPKPKQKTPSPKPKQKTPSPDTPCYIIADPNTGCWSCARKPDPDIYNPNELDSFPTCKECNSEAKSRNTDIGCNTSPSVGEYYRPQRRKKPTENKKTNPFIDSRLYVRKTKNKGFGIFTKDNIKKDSIIEISIPMKVIHKEFKKGILNASMWVYSSKKHKYCDLGTGFASLYNHEKNANIEIYGDKGLLIYKAKRDIKKNEEICINYGYKNWGKKDKPKDFDPKKLSSYIYVHDKLEIKLDNKYKNKNINLDKEFKNNLNSNLFYNVYAKENIEKGTVIEITRCGVYKKDSFNIKKTPTLKNAFFYDKKFNKVALPHGFSNLYKINKNDFNVNMILKNEKLKFITNRNIKKGEPLVIKSKVIR